MLPGFRTPGLLLSIESLLTLGPNEWVQMASSGVVLVGVIITGLFLRSLRSRKWVFGIATQVAVHSLVMVIAVSGAIGFVGYEYLESVALEKAADALYEKTHVGGAEIITHIQEIQRDAIFLTRTPPTRGLERARVADGLDPYDGSTEEALRDRLATLFTSFVSAKPYYLEARLVSASKEIGSIVRVARPEGAIVKAVANLPSTHEDDAYFQELGKLELGEVHLTPITFHTQEGHLDGPSTPVLKAVAPVFSADGAIHMAIVILVNVRPMLEKMARSWRKGSKLYVANEQGRLLEEFDPAAGPSSPPATARTIQARFPALAGFFRPGSTQTDRTIHTTIRDEEVLLHLFRVSYDPGNTRRFLVIGVAEPVNALSLRAAPGLDQVLFMVLILVALASLLALASLHIITEPLNTITQAIRAFTAGRQDITLPEGTKGEIGILSRAFRAMIETVKQRGLELAQSEATVRKILHNAPDGIVTYDHDGTILSFNHTSEHIFGYEAEEMLGKKTAVLFSKGVRAGAPTATPTCAGQKSPAGGSRDVELVGVRKSGETFPLSYSVTEIDAGQTCIRIGRMRDITEEKRAQEQLRLAAKVMETSLQAIAVTDARGNIQSTNPMFTTMTGYQASEALGKDPKFLRSGRHDPAFYAEMWNQLLLEGQWQGEIWDRRKDGQEFPAAVSINAIVDETGTKTHYVGMFSDITDRKASEARLTQLAHFDPLTALPNRRLFQDRLQQSIEQARRERTSTALLFVDLDRFKDINDTLGHDLGDLLLVEVAKRIKRCLRGSDMVARLGGDEFTVIIHDHQQSSAPGTVATKILASLAAPISIKEHECHIRASIGISRFPSDGEDVQSLLQHADIAMYQAKDAGGDAFREYNKDMSSVVARRRELELELRYAIARDQLQLMYQPQTAIATGQIIGVEALLRWTRANGERVSPAEFIPLAEETGLISPIGAWVLRAACTQQQAWEKAGIAPRQMAVNVSARQLLDDDFLEMVREAISSAGIDAHCLELELTESAIMERAEIVLPLLSELSGLGIHLSIDDFGTGYSSLSYLKRMPLNSLKIDRSFVRDLEEDNRDAAIIRATLSMAHSLGLSVVAEGIETPEQLAFLAAEGCDIGQGYLMWRPMSAAAVGEALARERQAEEAVMSA